MFSVLQLSILNYKYSRYRCYFKHTIYNRFTWSLKKNLRTFCTSVKKCMFVVLAEDSLLQKGYNSRRIRQLTTARLCRRESLWRHRINTCNASTHFKVSLSYHFSSHIPSSTKNKSKFPTDTNDDRRHIIELRRNGFFFFWRQVYCKTLRFRDIVHFKI